jgi:hypothetical protein
MATKIANFFLENDPSPEFGQKFYREFTQMMTRYKEIHNNLTENKKQPLITQFVKKY